MGIIHNVGVTNLGLVFGYDTGLPVNTNFVGTRFYPGEPTTNLKSGTQTSGIINGMSGISIAYVGEENGYQKYSMNGTFSGGTYPYIMFLSSQSFTGGVKYSTQVKYKTNVPGKFNYFGTQGINYVNQPMDHGGTKTVQVLPDGFNLVTRQGFAYTSTTSQPGYLLTNPINNTTFSSSTDFVYVKDFQIEQQDHCTPFTASSRSSTTSLIDLKRGKDINLSSVSFNSSGQPDYDGTDDKGVVSNFPHIWTGSLTMECVIKFEDTGRSIIFGNYNQGSDGGDVNFEHSDRELRFYWNRGEKSVWTSGDVVTADGSSYHHCVFVRDIVNNQFRFYVDGSQVHLATGVGTNINQDDVGTNHSTFRIGGDTRNGDTIHNGEIPIIRVYNRALAASDVTRNFNAYKNRFDL